MKHMHQAVMQDNILIHVFQVFHEKHAALFLIAGLKMNYSIPGRKPGKDKHGVALGPLAGRKEQEGWKKIRGERHQVFGRTYPQS